MYLLYWSILAWALFIHLLIGLYKKSLKRKILWKFSREATSETSDQYVEYYQKAQKIDFLRVLGWFGVLSVVLYVANTGFLTWLAIWVWAIIVTFGSFIVSMIYYFYLTTEFRVGQTVRIGEKRQGEIISIKPLYLWLSGKNENGEHTGEFYLVPNKVVRENTITKIDLRKTAIKKVLVDIPFESEKRWITYDEMLSSLKEFLKSCLTLNTPTTVGYYKSYIGWRYKLDIEYKENWTIMLHLWFLDTLANHRKTKQKIIAFVESMKKPQEQRDWNCHE
jgi:hypothetical protein